MDDKVVFIKLKKNVKLQREEVYIQDIAQIQCKNESLQNRLNKILLYKFGATSHNCYCIGILQVIHEIQKMEQSVTVQCLGEVDCVIYKEKIISPQVMILKVVFVGLVCFFGTAFTIMAFHNDIGIVTVFDQIQRIVAGSDSGGLTILEVSYSIGLGLGIIIFFNHIGMKKITKQPTPIEVSMCTYENDVDQTIVEEFEKEGKSKQ